MVMESRRETLIRDPRPVEWTRLPANLILTMLHYDFPLVPFLFATALSVNGLRKRSLSPSGAAAAFLTGISMLSLPLRTPGIVLIAFYLLGSSATRAGHLRKAALEDGHDQALAGYRTAAQVFSNSASALIATLTWGALHAPGFPGVRVAEALFGVRSVPYVNEAWCPLDAAITDGWSRALLFVVLGYVFPFSPYPTRVTNLNNLPTAL